MPDDAGTGGPQGGEDADLSWLDDEEFDEEEFEAAWDAARADAVALLREALPEVRALEPPQDALVAAAASLRAGLARGGWTYGAMRRAAGWRPKRLPKDDRELWLGATGGLVEARDETGMDAEEEAAIMTLELADWLGAVIGLIRAGVGARAEPEDLIRYIDECPEIEGEIDPDDETLVGLAFELVLPVWQVAGALDEDRRLTELGRWGLPRALAWAWGGDFEGTSA